MATQDSPSLYERLGGVYSIATVMDDFIDRIMIDPVTSRQHSTRIVRSALEEWIAVRDFASFHCLCDWVRNRDRRSWKWADGFSSPVRQPVCRCHWACLPPRQPGGG
jgi:hypothetical protein